MPEIMDDNYSEKICTKKICFFGSSHKDNVVLVPEDNTLCTFIFLKDFD